MSKKGVSAEEKRSRMLQLFYERGECFTLKELEKLASKEKGIVANSVKDVLQQLVENGLVDTDKIGTSVYFWAFPSKAVTIKKRELADLEQKTEENSNKLKVMDKTLATLGNTEDEESIRKKILVEINASELQLLTLKQKLTDYQENDPKKFDKLVKKTDELKEATNRWTDNVFSIKSWCKKKFMLEDKVINKQFNIPEDFDYVE